MRHHQIKRPVFIQTFKKYSPWLIWGIAAIFYFYEYVLRVSPTIITSQLMQNFHITAALLGALSSYYFYAYGFMQIPAGILLDRYPVKYVLSAAALICGVSAIGFATSHTYFIAAVSRFLMGAGSAFAFIGCLKIINNHFPTKHIARLSGLTMTVGAIGAVMGEAPLVPIENHFGWRHSIVGIGILGLMVAVALFVYLPKHKSRDDGSTEGTSALLSGIWSVMKHKHNWALGLLSGLIYAPAADFGAMWGVPFLKHVYHLPTTTAAGITSMIWIGWVIGSPLFGWIADRYHHYFSTIAVGLVGQLILLFSILHFQHFSVSTLFLLTLLLGIFASSMSVCYAWICLLNDKKVAASSTALINVLVSVFNAPLMPLVGLALEVVHRGHVTTLQAYTAHDFRHALLLLPLYLVAATLVMPWLRRSTRLMR